MLYFWCSLNHNWTKRDGTRIGNDPVSARSKCPFSLTRKIAIAITVPNISINNNRARTPTTNYRNGIFIFILINQIIYEIRCPRWKAVYMPREKCQTALACWAHTSPLPFFTMSSHFFFFLVFLIAFLAALAVGAYTLGPGMGNRHGWL